MSSYAEECGGEEREMECKKSPRVGGKEKEEEEKDGREAKGKKKYSTEHILTHAKKIISLIIKILLKLIRSLFF